MAPNLNGDYISPALANFAGGIVIVSVINNIREVKSSEFGNENIRDL